MFIFVVVSLFSAWQWTDATPEISMGLEFTSSKVVFLDMDGDGDVDMLRTESEGVEALENTADEPESALWTPNDNLAKGITPADDCSLGAGDLNHSGTEEIVIVDGSNIFAYVNIDTAWVKDTTLFDDIHEGSIPHHPDFADVDGDGDVDMLGGLDKGNHPYLLTMWWNTGTPEEPQWKLDTTYFELDESQGQIDMMRFAGWIDWNSDEVMDVVFTRWYYDHDWDDVDVILNLGTGSEPQWERRTVHGTTIQNDIQVLDWNSDDTDDIVLVDYSAHPEGYQYVPGGLSGDSIVRDFEHPYFWGGLFSNYPAAADVCSDGIPELALVKYEYHWDFEFPSPKEYFLPHLKRYSYSEAYNLWQRDSESAFTSLEPPDEDPFLINPAHLQYADFGNDGLCDHVLNLNGENTLYRNQGTASEPDWVEDPDALQVLPELFPSCFLDIDGDGDKDVIGESTADYEDSTVVGYINTGTDEEPAFEPHHDFVTGLPSYGLSFLSPGDLTDNQLALPDLAVNTEYQGLLAYFNSGQDNPRWQEREDVFADIEGDGNPALCDADADGDLDLYLVQGGRLHFYYNESTGGVTEKPSATNAVSIRYSERGARISLALSRAVNATLRLYDVSGRRVMTVTKPATADEVTFTVSKIPGVYFYNINAGEKTHTGKLVVY